MSLQKEVTQQFDEEFKKKLMEVKVGSQIFLNVFFIVDNNPIFSFRRKAFSERKN